MFKWISNFFQKKKEKKEKKAQGLKRGPMPYVGSGGYGTTGWTNYAYPPATSPYSDQNPITNPAPTYDPTPSEVNHDNYPSYGNREHTTFKTGGGFGGEIEFHTGGSIPDNTPSDHSFTSSHDTSSSFSSDYASSSSSYDSGSSFSGGSD